MKRQKRYQAYEEFEDSDDVPLQTTKTFRPENAIEAQVQDGDTLQALALRFHCTIAEIKRLNKIDKDNEIFARKVVKVPITPHSILLEEFPIVHKSGQNSPKTKDVNDLKENGLIKNQLEEKLLVASVNTSAIKPLDKIHGGSTNSINPNQAHYRGHEHYHESSVHQSLLDYDDDERQPRPIPVPSAISIYDCSGSDCDISWIFLFICILALCVAIPLIYVVYIAEKTSERNHSHNHSSF